MSLAYYSPVSSQKNANRILLIQNSEGKLFFRLDTVVFPLFCTKCHADQSHLYVHMSSRNKLVGTTICEKCHEPITVQDTGDMVESILINDELIDFRKLYLLDEHYIEELDQKFSGAMTKVLLKNYQKSSVNSITINELVQKGFEATSVMIDSSMRFETDERLPFLPSEIHQWIEFLYRCNISLPENVKIIRKGNELESLKSSGIWSLNHPDEISKRFKKKSFPVFPKKILKKV